jgi:hypothetical protein
MEEFLMKKANSTDIHFHVDEETNSILQEKLQETQLTPSAFLRKLIRDGQITYTPYGKEMLIQLAKTHNEVNQGMLAIDNEISNLSQKVDRQNQYITQLSPLLCSEYGEQIANSLTMLVMQNHIQMQDIMNRTTKLKQVAERITVK